MRANNISASKWVKSNERRRKILILKGIGWSRLQQLNASRKKQKKALKSAVKKKKNDLYTCHVKQKVTQPPPPLHTHTHIGNHTTCIKQEDSHA